MPVRMVDDQPDPNEYQDNSGGGRGGGGTGGGGGLLGLLPLLFTLFRKPGGLLILLLLAGGYFLLNQQGCGSMLSSVTNQFAKGGMLDKNEFAKANVYEGLADDDTRNPLPEFVSLLKFAPDRQNQGQQGSCVAWSSAYAAQTILMSSSRGAIPNEQAFSPSYMYNQIGLDGCQGSYIIRAMNLMSQKGGVPFNEFPYNDADCSTNPPNSLDAMANNNKIHGFNRLTSTEDPEGINIRAVKEHLASGAPVVIGMMVGGSFMQEMMGQKVWLPNQSDYQQMGFGGHAMCIIGYDDKLAGGSFQIMNSWGPEWGENGVGWVRYGDFKEFVREAYGIDPMPQQGAALNQAFDCEIGLVQVNEKGKPVGYLSLSGGSNHLFTSSTVPKGTRFKVEVKNSTECYVYVFGQETDGSSYTLFPYPSAADASKTAYTPYCGITGYRLFPKNKSMMPDSIGTQDFIALVVSKEELPWNKLNQEISKAGTNYANAVATALQSYGVGKLTVNKSNKGNMHFTAPAGAKGVAYAIVAINKQ